MEEKVFLKAVINLVNYEIDLNLNNEERLEELMTMRDYAERKMEIPTPRLIGFER